MATYGDKYLFTFEVRASSAAVTSLNQVTTSAAAAAAAVNALASAWDRLTAAMATAPVTGVNIVNSAISNTGNALTSAGGGGGNTVRTTNRTTVKPPPTPQPNGLLDNSHLARHAMFAAEAIAIMSVFQAVTAAVGAWINVQKTLDRQMVEFGYSVRQTAGSVLEYRKAVQDIASETGVPIDEVGKSVTMQMRVRGAPSDLARRAAEVQMLTGVDNMAVTRDLLSLSKQFPDKTTVQILDAFMGAMSRSTLEAGEFFGMLESAGPLSKQFNTSFESILGMFAGLSTAAGESGSSIELFMRQMERVYTEDSTRSVIEQLTGKQTVTRSPITGEEVRRPFDDVMADISKLSASQVQKIAETIPNMLGQQTRQLFMSMVQNWETVVSAINNSKLSSGTFDAAFNEMEKTMDASLARMTTAWQRFLASIGDTTAFKAAVGGITSILDGVAKSTEMRKVAGEYFDKIGAGGFDPAKRVEIVDQLRQRYSNNTGDVTVKGQWNGAVMAGGGTGAMTDAQVEWLYSEFLKLYSGEGTVDGRRLHATIPYASPSKVDPLLSSLGYSSGVSGDRARFLSGLPIVSENRLPMIDQQIELGKGVTPTMVSAMYDRLVRERMEGRRNMTMPDGSQPYLNSTDTAIAKSLGLDKQTTASMVDGTTGSDIGALAGEIGTLQDAAKLANDEMEKLSGKVAKTFTFETSAADLNKQRMNGSDLERSVQEYEKRIASIRASAVKANPELANKSREEVLAFAGISEQYVTLVDDQGNVLRRVFVDLGLFASGVERVGVAARKLEYNDLPEGWSADRYFGVLQSGSNANLDLQRKMGIDPGQVTEHLISTPGGTRSVWGTDESISAGERDVSRLVGIESDAASKAQAAAEKQRALLERIAGGISSFAADLLKGTPVTEGDMARAKLGTYSDQWDEPVRRVRDVVERRKSMNPNLGPWKDYASGLGIDVSSIEGAIASGAEFERKFYNGLMPREFYEANSKEGFLSAARGKLEERQGQRNLQQMAEGWLKEAGISGDIADLIGREMSGELSPMEQYWRGGKTDKELAGDMSKLGKSSTTGITAGFKESVEDAKPVEIFAAAWNMGDKSTQDSLKNLGKSVGGTMVGGVSDAIADAILPEVTSKVLAAILASKPGGK